MGGAGLSVGNLDMRMDGGAGLVLHAGLGQRPIRTDGTRSVPATLGEGGLLKNEKLCTPWYARCAILHGWAREGCEMKVYARDGMRGWRIEAKCYSFVRRWSHTATRWRSLQLRILCLTRRVRRD